MATALLPIPVPTLSLDGWVRDAKSKLDYLLSHFFESEKSQTALYGSHVSSLQWILQKYQGDMTQTNREVTECLNVYMARYFPVVNVNTQIDPEVEGGTRQVLRIFLSVKDVDGVEIQVNKLVDIQDSKIASVIDLINNGPEQ